VLAAITMRLLGAAVCDEARCASVTTPSTPRMHGIIFEDRMIASPFHQ
jgi:hypothetical protein